VRSLRILASGNVIITSFGDLNFLSALSSLERPALDADSDADHLLP
jgi:hypothetical protein